MNLCDIRHVPHQGTAFQNEKWLRNYCYLLCYEIMNAWAVSTLRPMLIRLSKNRCDWKAIRLVRLYFPSFYPNSTIRLLFWFNSKLIRGISIRVLFGSLFVCIPERTRNTFEQFIHITILPKKSEISLEILCIHCHPCDAHRPTV